MRAAEAGCKSWRGKTLFAGLRAARKVPFLICNTTPSVVQSIIQRQLSDTLLYVNLPYHTSVAIARTETYCPARVIANAPPSEPVSIDIMGDAEVKTSAWRLVEVGRVVLFTTGPYKNKLATIVEIIDHKRVRFDRDPEDWRHGRFCSRMNRFFSMVQPPSQRPLSHATPLLSPLFL